MLRQLVLAAVVAGAAFIVCLVLGNVLAGIPPVAVVGSILVTWAWLIGLLAGVWYYFRGSLTP